MFIGQDTCYYERDGSFASYSLPQSLVCLIYSRAVKRGVSLWRVLPVFSQSQAQLGLGQQVFSICDSDGLCNI